MRQIQARAEKCLRNFLMEGVEYKELGLSPDDQPTRGPVSRESPSAISGENEDGKDVEEKRKKKGSRNVPGTVS